MARGYSEELAPLRARPLSCHFVSWKVAMDLETDAGRLLDQLDVLRHPSDLDLLIFFARHPRVLLSSEQLAAFLGYGVKEVAASLELLLDAGFLTRTPNPRHVARMYVLAVTPPGGAWLPALRRLAGTREGRLALIWEIRRRPSDAVGGPQSAV
jgi:DNA-binding MarR family transcriptional regulator